MSEKHAHHGAGVDEHAGHDDYAQHHEHNAHQGHGAHTDHGGHETHAGHDHAGHTGHGYISDKARYLARLRRIEGQARGIHRMIDEDAYCIDILTPAYAEHPAQLLELLENYTVELSGDEAAVYDHLYDQILKAVEGEQ